MRTVPSAGHNASQPDLHSLQTHAAFDFVHNTPQCHHSFICVSNMQLNSSRLASNPLDGQYLELWSYFN
jgi:hypothetical protein